MHDPRAQAQSSRVLFGPRTEDRTLGNVALGKRVRPIELHIAVEEGDARHLLILFETTNQFVDTGFGGEFELMLLGVPLEANVDYDRDFFGHYY